MVSGRRKLTFLLSVTGIGLLQALLLWQLPYTTSDITHLKLTRTESPAFPEGSFQIGELVWDMQGYASDDSLTPYRNFFNRHCGKQQGVDAARCLSDLMLDKIPFGEPSSEPFQQEYSPRKAFEGHMKGAPGHCVTYAGLTSLILLASGIPARMVQIVPVTKPGHNVIEIWDAQYGWVLFDPLNKISLHRNGRPVSAIEAVTMPKDLIVVSTKAANGRIGYLKEYYQEPLPFDGAIVYPEPWLYTRSGKQTGYWFYRSQFAVVGANFYWMGRAQRLLRWGILICLVMASVNIVLLIRPGIRWSHRKVHYYRVRGTLPAQGNAGESVTHY